MNMNENPGKLNRRVVLTAPLGGLALASLGGLAAHGDDGSTVPKYRMIGVAMPDVTAGTDRHKELASWCEKARINKVGLVAGRVDWTAFPSQDRSSWSSDFGENGDKDPLRDAINIFSGDDDPGQKIVLVVDAQAERIFKKCPKFAGIDTEGRAKTNLPSLTALVKEDSQGKFGKDIISLATELVERYNPSAISLTDLYFEDSTYGEDDLNHFRAATGESDWPRDDANNIKTDDERIVAWRCKAMAGFVARVRDAVHSAGNRRCELWMEVRSPRNDPHGDRKDNGQDYGLLADAADRLVLWDYFGTEPDYLPTRDLAAAFTERTGGSGVLSVGLWGREREDLITPDELETAVKEAVRGGSDWVWVTPTQTVAQPMTDAHWEALVRAWNQ